MRLRQLALVAPDLEPAVDDLCEILELEVCFHDPQVAVFGLRNALLPVGPDAFLEVLAPVRPDTPAGRHLERHGGPGGYMVIVQTDDLTAARRRVERLGIRIVWEIALDDAATIHLHPRDIGGAIVSIDAMVPAESWRWAGPDWRRHVRTTAVRELVGATLAARDPASLSGRWAAVLDRPTSAAAGGRYALPLATGTLWFAPLAAGERERLAGVTLRVVDPEPIRARAGRRGLPVDDDGVSIAGVRFALVR